MSNFSRWLVKKLKSEKKAKILILGLDAAGNVSFAASTYFADNKVDQPKFKDYSEEINALGDTGGGSDEIDIEAGNVVTATVSTGAQTFTFAEPSTSGTAACSFTLILTNGGSQTVSWPGAVKWAGGDIPGLTVSGVDILVFTTIDAGTIWYGFAAGLDMKSP